MPHRKNVEGCEGDNSARLLLLSTAVKDPETLEGKLFPFATTMRPWKFLPRCRQHSIRTLDSIVGALRIGTGTRALV